MPTTVLNSKLHPPLAGVASLGRSRLHRQLDAGVAVGCPLLLLSAPAGYGKTTLVSEWLRESSHQTAWLSLDESDNDPLRFWRYVVAALRTVEPRWGERAEALLDLSPAPAPDTFVSTLLQEIEGAPPPHPTLLVLDDYHLIHATPIHDSLLFLLTHLPPRLHLVLLSRADPPLPLARLRVQGNVLEVRANDLRFTLEEVREWLNQTLALGLPPEALATLAARTEGWAAGLQLAALSLKGRDEAEVTAFLDTFSGTHQHILSYLLEEVLTRQPAAVQQFLLHTSILRRLSAPLCEALVSQEEGGQRAGYAPHLASVQQMLAYLEQEGLFITRLDAAGEWYRYHYLFAETLQARLQATQPAHLPHLHRRAAEWYAAQGQFEAAVRHALAGEAWEVAAALIENAAEALWSHGGLSTLLGWLEQLPEEVVERHLQLQLLHGWMLFLHDRYDEAWARWEKAEPLLKGAADEGRLQGVLAAMRGALTAMRQDAARTIPLAEEALRHLPPDDRTWRGVTTINLGLAHAARGAVLPAIRAFQEAVAVCQRADNTYLTFVALWHLAEARLAAGQLREAERLYEQLGRLDDPHASHPLVLPGYAETGRGRVAYERNEVEAAEAHLVAGMSQLPPDAQPRVLLTGFVTRARVRQARGEAEAARAFMQQAATLVERVGLDEERGPLAARRAQLALQQGRQWEAQAWVEASGLSADDDPDYRREVEHLVLARVLIAQDDAAAAQRLLDRLLARAEQAHRTGSVLEILILLALAQAAQQQSDAALATLRRALTLAEPEGYVRLFLDEGPPLTRLLRQLDSGLHAHVVRHLLAFTPSPPSSTPPSLPHLPLDPLTDREMDVLALMAQGATNQQIADELVIGVGTVKGHINHILSKLDAQNRTEAVVRAQRLHLLESQPLT